jgi:hypothetical protein
LLSRSVEKVSDDAHSFVSENAFGMELDADVWPMFVANAHHHRPFVVGSSRLDQAVGEIVAFDRKRVISPDIESIW